MSADRIAELEAKVEQLEAEVERLRYGFAWMGYSADAIVRYAAEVPRCGKPSFYGAGACRQPEKHGGLCL